MESQIYVEKIHRPTDEQFKEIAAKYGFCFSEKEVSQFQKLIDVNLNAYDFISKQPDYLPLVKYPRTPGYPPNKSENHLGAWYYKTEIKGASCGKLFGRKIVLKDNICLAGVPLMNGSYNLEGYIPEIDATLVQRILDEGGIIVGKAHCEDQCSSGGSFTNFKNPVHNPHKMGYMSGGSSSGVGALVGSGEVEMGIGGDQGGSIRIPSCWCGIYGMKPTHGLVPYTGIIPIEPTLDHAGPMTNNVTDNALLLEVIAGPDGLDPRQYIQPNSYGNYTKGLSEGVKGLKIGILKEGFGHKESEEIVDRIVKRSALFFQKLGAEVEEMSIPEHLESYPIFKGVISEGDLNMMNGNGFGSGYRGLYIPSLMKAQSRWKTHPNEISETQKLSIIMSDYVKEEFDGTMYAKAQNLGRKIKDVYNEAFQKFDIIIMPTLPYRAPQIPKIGCDLEKYFSTALGMGANTSVFDLTGHPAMNIPVAKVDGLPIGMMLASKHFGESLIYKAAYAWEQSYDWKTIQE